MSESASAAAIFSESSSADAPHAGNGRASSDLHITELHEVRTINQGLVDTGWKDTVLVWPGERVKIAMMFGPHAGMYMYHCHILEHEDMTMMRNYMIMDHSMPM